MANIALKVEERSVEEIGGRASRKLKAQKSVPAVVYGLDKKPLSVKVDEKTLRDTLKGHNISSVILDLHLGDDKKDKKEAVIIKDYQRDPVTRNLIHLDFLRIQMKKEIETSIPIKILNEENAIGIKEKGGVLQHSLREINISCLPADIPENIGIDIKDLDIGSAIRISDISADEKIKLLNDPDEVIVSIIHATQLKEEELAPEEGEEIEEPELIGREKESEEEPGGEKREKASREE